jgi:hypothetical protein
MTDILTAPKPPTHDQRTHAFRNATWPEREAMHKAIAAHKSDAIAKRKELGRRLLEAHPDSIVLPFDRAAMQVSLAEETRAAREEALPFTKDKASKLDRGSLAYLALAHDFAADSAVIRLASSPLFIAPIARYCGMLPVLFNLFVTRAHQAQHDSNSAHNFHLDPEDVISFKVFIHLTEVDEDCGPFHALPAEYTRKVLHDVGYQGIRFITDEKVKELVGWDKVFRLIGPPGTVGLADTTRCLHFGGRPRKEGKPIRDMLVFQYLLPTSLLFPIDGDAKHPRFLPQLEPTGDPHWDALIGATLT